LQPLRQLLLLPWLLPLLLPLLLPAAPPPRVSRTWLVALPTRDPVGHLNRG